MDNFKVIYKILKSLEKAMDLDEFDPEMISAETLGISQKRWESILEMLVKDEYIDGVTVKVWINGEKNINLNNISITLKGLEYLQSNSMMKKVGNAIKGVADMIP